MSYYPWSSKTIMVSRGPAETHRSSMKPNSMPQVQKLMERIKAARSKAGLPKRAISPVSLWIFDDLINEYFEKHAASYVLESVQVKKGAV